MFGVAHSVCLEGYRVLCDAGLNDLERLQLIEMVIVDNRK
jgi:hypothetical protein